MIEQLSIVVLAAGPGAMIGLMAMGLITIYRSSGVLYLAQPAVATVGGYMYVEFVQPGRFSPAVAVALASVSCGLLSMAIYALAMRPLARTSPLTKLVASIGVAQILISALFWRYGDDFYRPPRVFPTGPVDLPFDVTAGGDRLALIAAASLVTLLLWAGYRFTRFGLATAAVAESPFFASLFGIRSSRLAYSNWLVAGLVAGFAGALLSSINGINLQVLTDLMVPILAAALIGSLTSFPIAFAAAIGIAVVQAEVIRVSSSVGVVALVPFLALFLVMMIRGGGPALRNFTEPKLPQLGTGRIRWISVGVIVVVSILVIQFWVPFDLLRPVLTNVLFAIILLSVVVVTGFAGQLSLANMVIAGVGAFFAAEVASRWGVPFIGSLIVGMAVSAAVSAMQALPAIRLKSVNLAIITLGFGAVLYAFFLGAEASFLVPEPSIFGIDLSTVGSLRNYVIFSFIILVLAMIVVANLRRSRSGLRMVAVRGNERAASSMGINVWWAKMVAFAVAGGIAGLGGVLIASQTSTQSFENFAPSISLDLISWATIGGVAFVLGPILGSFLAPDSLGSSLGHAIYDNTAVLGFVGGILLILTLINHPDGAINLPGQVREHLRHRRNKALSTPDPDAGAADAEAVSAAEPHAFSREADVEGRGLRVEGISVRFGGVHALTDVSFSVKPGSVHGLIGSNGSGKTTLLDVISGFTEPTSGSVLLGDADLSALTAWRRARVGLGRSFQNGQLLNDLTVHDNLVAATLSGTGSLIRDLTAPERLDLSETGFEVARNLDLMGVMDRRVDSLTQGQRQLVSIARSLVAEPHFVLLDEPAAGLDDAERLHLRDLLPRIAQQLNIAILLVEHDVNLVLEVCDSVTVLNQGQVIADGEPWEIRQSQEVRDAYLGESHTVSADASTSKGE